MQCSSRQPFVSSETFETAFSSSSTYEFESYLTDHHQDEQDKDERQEARQVAAPTATVKQSFLSCVFDMADLISDSDQDDYESVGLCLFPDEEEEDCKDQEIPSNPVVMPQEDKERAVRRQRTMKLSDLTDDLQWQILSFLDHKEVCEIMQVNKRYNALLKTENAREALWKGFCLRQWPLLNRHDTVNEYQRPLKFDFVDNFRATKTKPTTTKDDADLTMSLQLATKIATVVDEAAFAPSRWSRQIRRFRERVSSAVELRTLLVSRPASAADKEDDHQSQRHPPHPQNAMSAVQFTGSIGQGDRCIRGDVPMPRPVLLSRKQQQRAAAFAKRKQRKGGGDDTQQSNSSNRRNILTSILRSTLPGSSSDSDLNKPRWKPFVAPFMEAARNDDEEDNDENDNDFVDRVKVNMTPRLVSYFEVTILPDPNKPLDSDDDDEDTGVQRFAPPPAAAGAGADGGAPRRPGMPPVEERPTRSECIAVGLANPAFRLHSRMPGWDDRSYGYHGDDGGIFHGQGNMLKSFGPRYGAGDTVGCGVDYHRGAIFFTINGEFLGYAFDNLDRHTLRTPWYPVVGLDSHCPVVCNFGIDQPYMFDLTHMIEQQKQVVQAALQV